MGIRGTIGNAQSITLLTKRLPLMHRLVYVWSKSFKEKSCGFVGVVVQLLSCPDVSSSLWLHGLQQSRPPCHSPSPGVCPSSCPLHRWYHPAISSSDALLLSFCPRSCPQSLWALLLLFDSNFFILIPQEVMSTTFVVNYSKQWT